ncbi:MAG: hypothetical protein HY791_21925 [Deltaproteobacteria bacterium]|nr:hypothetical protein [Deltaproteobacteria bacterium]
MVRALVLVAASALHCSADVVLTLPDHPNALSSIVLFFDPDGSLAGSYASQLEMKTAREAGTGVRLFLYDHTLSELELSEGPLPKIGSRSCLLTRPIGAYEATVGEGQSWSKAEMTPELATRLVPDRVQRCPGCVSFVERRISLAGALTSTRSLVVTAAWLDSQDVVVTTAGEGIVLVDRSEAHRIEGCDDATYWSLHPLGEDRFWAGAPQGRLDQIRVDQGSRTCSIEQTYELEALRVPTADGDATGPFLAGSAPGQPSELYQLSAGGSLDRINENGLTHLWQGKLAVAHSHRTASHDGGLIYLGPGAVAAIYSAPETLWWRDGRAEITPIRLIATTIMTAFGHVPGVGFLAASGAGEVFLTTEPGESWLSLSSPVRDDLAVFLPFHGGFIATSRRGRIVQYYAHTQFCSEVFEAPGSLKPATKAVVATDREIFIGDAIHADSEVAEVIWLTPS